MPIFGFGKKDLKVDVKDNHITVSGEKKVENKSKKDGHTHYECSYGKFERVVHIPKDVDQAGIKAKLKDGVLTLELPKGAEPDRKPIDVKVE